MRSLLKGILFIIGGLLLVPGLCIPSLTVEILQAAATNPRNINVVDFGILIAAYAVVGGIIWAGVKLVRRELGK